ncbi:hypothetical protein Hte_008062 [Hypoxylon texense]
MATSFNFNGLPAEFRAIIWNLAIYHEARSRIILVDEQRILPYKYLCSPFLSVNSESRLFARKLYSVGIGVSSINFRRDMLKDFRSHFIYDRGCISGFTSVNENDILNRGVIYISPEADNFIMGEFLEEHFYVISKNLNCVDRERQPQRDTILRVADKLPVEVCARVQNLSYPIPAIRENTEDAVSFQKSVFTGVRGYKTIWTSRHYSYRGLTTLIHDLPFIVERLCRNEPTALIDDITEEAVPTPEGLLTSGGVVVSVDPVYREDVLVRAGVDPLPRGFPAWLKVLAAAREERRTLTRHPLPTSALISLSQGFDMEARSWVAANGETKYSPAQDTGFLRNPYDYWSIM